MTTDAEALNAANYLKTRYASPGTRLPQLAFKPQSDEANAWPQALGRELGDRVTVKRRPPPSGSAVFSQAEIIEGIQHAWMIGTLWKTAFLLSNADTVSWWILGSTTNGVLGTTTRPGY